MRQLNVKVQEITIGIQNGNIVAQLMFPDLGGGVMFELSTLEKLKSFISVFDSPINVDTKYLRLLLEDSSNFNALGIAHITDDKVFLDRSPSKAEDGEVEVSDPAEE